MRRQEPAERSRHICGTSLESSMLLKESFCVSCCREHSPPTEGDLIAIERNQSTYQKMPTLVLYELALSGHSPVHRHRPTVLRARTLRPKRRTYATTDRVL